MCVRNHHAAECVGQESAAVSQTGLNPEHAALQTLEQCCGWVHATIVSAQEWRRRCWIHESVVIRQVDRRRRPRRNRQPDPPPKASPLKLRWCDAAHDIYAWRYGQGRPAVGRGSNRERIRAGPDQEQRMKRNRAYLHVAIHKGCRDDDVPGLGWRERAWVARGLALSEGCVGG